jgi:hypothetical protein
MSHFPGHLRDAFAGWVDEGMPAEAVVEVNYERVDWPPDRLLGQMSHCTDIMPATLCDELGMRYGSTYAAAAQALLRERKRAANRPG